MEHTAKNMTDHQKNLLIDTFMYYCPMEIRSKLIREIPQAYNAYVGRDVAKVVLNSENA